MDYLNPGADSPLVVTAINFDSGGRAMLMLTDREIDEVRCELPVEVSFRKLRASLVAIRYSQVYRPDSERKVARERQIFIMVF